MRERWRAKRSAWREHADARTLASAKISKMRTCRRANPCKRKNQQDANMQTREQRKSKRSAESIHTGAPATAGEGSAQGERGGRGISKARACRRGISKARACRRGISKGRANRRAGKTDAINRVPALSRNELRAGCAGLLGNKDGPERLPPYAQPHNQLP